MESNISPSILSEKIIDPIITDANNSKAESFTADDTDQFDRKDDELNIPNRTTSNSERPQRKLQQQTLSSRPTKAKREALESRFRDPLPSDLSLLLPTKASMEVEIDHSGDDGFEANMESGTLLDLDRLLSKHIEIYWDGDRIFYPCTVRKRLSPSPMDPTDSSFAEFVVVYENDESLEEYTERLSLLMFSRRQSPRFASNAAPALAFSPLPITPTDSASVWRIWDGDDEDEYQRFLTQQKQQGIKVLDSLMDRKLDIYFRLNLGPVSGDKDDLLCYGCRSRCNAVRHIGKRCKVRKFFGRYSQTNSCHLRFQVE